VKKSKSQFTLEVLKLLIEFLNRHPMRGKTAVFLTFTFFGVITLVSTVLLVLKFCAPELVTVIEALK
jgi:hypothetical protein